MCVPCSPSLHPLPYPNSFPRGACPLPPKPGQIDVMVLYSVASLTTLGGITPAQMETIILEGLVGTNEAFVNSEVSVRFDPVHIGLVRSHLKLPFFLRTIHILEFMSAKLYYRLLTPSRAEVSTTFGVTYSEFIWFEFCGRNSSAICLHRRGMLILLESVSE